MQKDDRILKKKLPNRNNCYCWLKALENREIACPGLKVGSWSAKIHLPSNDTVYCATFIPTEASYFLKLFVEIH